METPKISVIMPVYNTPENFFRPAIESVLNQTFKNFELIIVNDGSTKNDITGVVKSYFDDRIKYINMLHIGAANARNVGLEMAIGDFILIMASDDVVDRNLYENLIKLANSYKPDIVIFNIYGGKDDGTIELYENIIPFKITNPGDSTKMVRRKLINNNYIRFQDLSSCNDVCFSYTCLAYATKVVKINKCFYHYNTNVPGQISENRGTKCYNICKAMDAVKFNLEKRNIFDIYLHDWLWVFRGAIKSESTYVSNRRKRGKFLRYVNIMYPELYPWRHRLFYKWYHDNGHVYVYLFGIRIFSYKNYSK